MKDELPASAPKEASAKMAPPKSPAKKQAKKKVPKPPSNLASDAEAWVESHKKEAGRTAALEQILQAIERYEESDRDPNVLESLPYDATEVIMEALGSSVSPEES